MKINSSILYMIMLVGFLGIQSCSEDDSNNSDDNIAGCNNFEANSEQFQEALIAYTQKPTPQTCEAYKDALLDFYDNYNDCPFWKDNYQEYYEEIENYNCSEEAVD